MKGTDPINFMLDNAHDRGRLVMKLTAKLPCRTLPEAIAELVDLGECPCPDCGLYHEKKMLT